MASFQKHTDRTPLIKGLVLIGGKSERMGKDKSSLNYHGKPQKTYIKELLESQGIESYYSVREGKHEDEISDQYPNLGPFGGIYSAFQKDPNSAWLVLATDLPFVNVELLQQLIAHRNPTKVATAVKGRQREFPEPLVTIYEPKVYPILKQHLQQGDTSPTHVLMQSDIAIVEVDDHFIRNVNTPEEYRAAKEELT